MRTFTASLMLLASLSFCGAQENSPITSFSSSYSHQPSGPSFFIDFDVSSGNVVLRTRDASTGNTNTSLTHLSGSRQNEVNSALKSLQISKIKDSYVYPEGGAGTVDGLTMNLLLTTESKKKSVLLDTTKIDELPTGLSFLFNFCASRKFQN